VTASVDQLDMMLEGDGLDSDDERVFEEYRKKRLEAMKQEEKKGRFGSMEPLSREDFVREVTEGSKVGPDGTIEEEEDDEDEDEAPVRRGLRGTGVVVFLYKDSLVFSDHHNLSPELTAACHCHNTFGHCCNA